MGDVFISYKQDERDRMRPIADGLRALGVDVWFDERLQPDRSFTEEIHQVMSACKAQIVCWSPAAVASEWVRGEAEVARQRGVLVAVMMEPCTLLPPFNMHHAESLVGWSGDPTHPGWRKVCDVIGRKLDRPGLGDLAGLQDSTDAAAWKKWAQKYSNDPLADQAWATAEELEVGAARERMARDRDAAKHAAAEVERRRSERPAAPASAPPPAPPAPQRRKIGLWVGGGIAAVAVLACGLYFIPPLLEPDEAEIAEAASSPEATTAVVAPGSEQVAPGSEAPVVGAGAQSQSPPTQDNGARAIAALNRIPEREWLHGANYEHLRRVVESSSFASLQAAARSGDSRAQVLMGMAHIDLGDDRFVPFSEAEAVRFFRQAANQGNAAAQFLLGRQIWVQGSRGITRTQASEAERWYKLSAEQGHVGAQMQLGNLYRSTYLTAEPNYQEAARYYRMAADENSAWGQTELGQLYLTGSGVPLDRDEGLRLLRLAARQDYAAAKSTLQNLRESW